MKAVYFAWVRERIGKNEEEIDAAGRGGDGRRARSPGSPGAARITPTLSRSRTSIRAAIDRAHVARDAPIAGAKEIAFFPPMTGG